MQTVIGVFDDKSAADGALATLRSSGFSDASIQVKGPDLDATGMPSTTTESGEGVLAEIGSFFSKLFGDDDKVQTHTYSEAVRRGGYVLTVDVDNEDQADTVAATLDDAGAYDIDERSTQWQGEGWTSPDVQSDIGMSAASRGSVRVVQRAPGAPVSDSVVSSDWKAGKGPQGGL